MSIGRIHSDSEMVVKLTALIEECKVVYGLNKLMRENPRFEVTGICHKIDSMQALALEVENEIKTKQEK